MGITRALDGADLVTGDRGIRILTDGMAPPAAAVAGPRIGIRHATDHPWRWHVPGSEHVSRTRARWDGHGSLAERRESSESGVPATTSPLPDDCYRPRMRPVMFFFSPIGAHSEETVRAQVRNHVHNSHLVITL